MITPECYPWRTALARNRCLAYLDELAATQWPIASQERRIPTSFGATFVRISGPPDAPLLLLLHGAATTSLMWSPNIEALSRDYRTVAVDQIGEFGRSECTRPPRSMQDLVTWLDELIASLTPRVPLRLAGMSYGGALAVQYALRFPERVERLVLLAPGATVLRPPAQFWLRLFALAIARRKGLPAFCRWIFADMARRSPRWIDSTVELLSINMQNVQRHRTPVPPVLTDAEWSSLRPPTLFLVGENEVIYPARTAVRRLQRVASQVTAEILPGAGHDLLFVQTAAVTKRILEFLNEKPSPPRLPVATSGRPSNPATTMAARCTP